MGGQHSDEEDRFQGEPARSRAILLFNEPSGGWTDRDEALVKRLQERSSLLDDVQIAEDERTLTLTVSFDTDHSHIFFDALYTLGREELAKKMSSLFPTY